MQIYKGELAALSNSQNLTAVNELMSYMTKVWLEPTSQYPPRLARILLEKAENAKKKEIEKAEKAKKKELEKAEKAKKKELEKAEKAEKKELEKAEKAKKKELEKAEKEKMKMMKKDKKIRRNYLKTKPPQVSLIFNNGL